MASAQLDVLRVFCAPDGSGGNPLGVFLDGPAVPEERRQPIAHDLGFAETVFVEDLNRAEMRIFTPETELPLAGHPRVGTAWLLRERGREPQVLRPPAGEVPVRFDGELACAAGRPAWCPPFEFTQLDSPADVEALATPPDGRDLVGAWAWIDEERGIMRERVFAAGAGVPEDEATGSAAIRLSALLRREIEIRQGEGSVIYARPLDGGLAEIRGHVVADERRDYEVDGA